MKTNQEFKNSALTALKGNWAPAVVCTIIMFAVMIIYMIPSMCMSSLTADPENMSMTDAILVLALFPVMSFLQIFLYTPMMYVGYGNAFKQLVADGDNNLVANLFKNTFHGYWKNVGASLLMVIFIFLWSLLFIIPGFIKGLAYSLTPYILKDYPELSANQAINLSMKMMKGHKFDLFWLFLSFIGWSILCIFTLGIGYLWLMPYMMTTMAAFYQEVKTEYINNNN